MQKEAEIWRFIPDMNLEYQISNLGKVKRLERLTIWNNKQKTLPEIIIKQSGKQIRIKSINYKVNDLMTLTGFKTLEPKKRKISPEKRTYKKRINFGIK